MLPQLHQRFDQRANILAGAADLMGGCDQRIAMDAPGQVDAPAPKW